MVSLCQGIIWRHSIAPERVLAHSDVALERKIDPGELFPWHFLYNSGISHCVAPALCRGLEKTSLGDTRKAVDGLQSMLALYGYEVEITGQFDTQTEVTIQVFQQHFHTICVDGVVDMSMISTLRRLLIVLPDRLPDRLDN